MTTFQQLCVAPDLAAAMRLVPDGELRNLIISMDGATGGIGGLILGNAEQEACRRWLNDTKDRCGAVGEGSL